MYFLEVLIMNDILLIAIMSIAIAL